MADRVKKVNYAYVMVSNRAGQGAAVMGAIEEAGISLLAYSGFPASRGRAQLDLVTDDLPGVRRVAARLGLRLSKVKRGFLIQGKDRIGAVQRHLTKLARAKINVTAADAVAAGNRRFGMILWVKKRDYPRAARALGAH
jgi:hypothetical protein